MSRPTTPIYGSLASISRPTTPLASGAQDGPLDGRKLPWELDPRHQPDAPCPWLRYFFPKDFDLREGSEENAYYQYFDVMMTPMEEDITVPPPKWTPNAYFRLSFTQANVPVDQDVAERMPVFDSPVNALDFTKNDWPIFGEKAQQHLHEVKRFCTSVATFKARTWKDAFPLVDLLRGLLLYLLSQMGKGQQLAEEYARRDAMRMVEEERVRSAERERKAVENKDAEMRVEMQAAVTAAKDATRKAVVEEMNAQIKAVADEKERWVQKSILGEQQLKKVGEAQAALQRQLEQLQQQLESERATQAKALADRDTQSRALSARVTELEDALVKAKKCIVDALKARGKKAEVLAVVASAASLAVPGAHAYVAALRSSTSPTGPEDPAMTRAKEALALDPDSPLKDALKALHPNFLSSPLGPTPTESGDVGPLPSLSDVQDSLVLRYTAASAGQDFMVGQNMNFGTGVSWAAVSASASAAGSKRGASGSVLLVPDVSERDGVHFFRPSAAAGASHGSYLAVPLLGLHGEVVGLLGVDTLAAAIAAAAATGGAAAGPGSVQLGTEQVDYITSLGAAANDAIAHEQQLLEDIMFKAALMNAKEEELEAAPVERDPEQYSDLKGGLGMMKEALNMLKDLSDEDLSTLQSVDKPDDATLAILRSALAAAGEVSDGDWPYVREQVSRNLVNKLLKLDPKGAWAQWKELCQLLAPLMNAESELGRLDATIEEEEPRATTPGQGGEEAQEQRQEAWQESKGSPVTKGLGSWLVAVRKISAAQALLVAYQERLHRANEALMRTFQGDGSSALVELRTYRVPPKITFQVLQAVLQLLGNSHDDCTNWGKMRMMTNYKMIKKLTEMKVENALVPHVKLCGKVARNLDEDDVKKESMATLILFKWIVNFARVGELTLQL